MIFFKNLRLAYIYIIILCFVSICLILLTPNGIRNYIPIIFGMGSFLIFGINATGYWYKFSSELKEKEPEIFKRNEVHYGYNKGNLILITNIFDDDEFKKIKDEKLYQLYLDSKKSYKLTIISFIIIPLLAILVINTNSLY